MSFTIKQLEVIRRNATGRFKKGLPFNREWRDRIIEMANTIENLMYEIRDTQDVNEKGYYADKREVEELEEQIKDLQSELNDLQNENDDLQDKLDQIRDLT